jgi:hypothetical protein
MPTTKKKAASKSAVKFRDLKSRRNPKGGALPVDGVKLNYNPVDGAKMP